MLKAVYYPPKNPNLRNPALLLLPMLNSGKEAWQNFAGAAQEGGHAVLALDLRGQGESGGVQDFGVMDQDIDVALNWLASRPEIAGDRIGLVGADLGANLALRAGSRHTQVKSVALLSPGLDYKGLTTLEALSAYGQRPVIIVAAENDLYAADSARTLNSQALGQHQLQIYPGSDHGINLLSAQAGLQPMLLAWFASTL
jgi:dienelactone hydrolase